MASGRPAAAKTGRPPRTSCEVDAATQAVLAFNAASGFRHADGDAATTACLIVDALETWHPRRPPLAQHGSEAWPGVDQAHIEAAITRRFPTSYARAATVEMEQLVADVILALRAASPEGASVRAEAVSPFPDHDEVWLAPDGGIIPCSAGPKEQALRGRIPEIGFERLDLAAAAEREAEAACEAVTAGHAQFIRFSGLTAERNTIANGIIGAAFRDGWILLAFAGDGASRELQFDGVPEILGRRDDEIQSLADAHDAPAVRHDLFWRNPELRPTPALICS